MNNRTINDDVDLRGRIITQPVSLSHLRFWGRVRVNGATFEHGFTIKDSVFEKAVDFSTVISRGPVDFSYSIFRFVPARAKDVSLDLSRTRVEGGLSLKYDCFLGPVDASLMAISGVLSVRNSWFLDRQASEDVPSLDLSNTVVGGNAVLKHNKIQPPVDFGNLIIRGSLDLHGTIIANGPTQRPAHGSWSCSGRYNPCRTSSLDGLRVEGPATFQGAVLQGCLSLHAASFGAIDPRIDPDAISKGICAAQIPSFEKPGPRDFARRRLTPDLSVPLDIDGLRYTQIAGGPDAIALMKRLINEHVLDRCQAIEEAIANKQQGIDPRRDACKPSDAKKAQAEAQGEARAGFALLESVAAAQGDRGSADDVFVRGRWWEFAHTKPWGSRVLQWISGEYVGFGRRPLQAIWAWLIFLLGGVTIFYVLWHLCQVPEGVNMWFYSVTCFLPPEWTGHYPAENFEKPAKWAIGIYVSIAFVLLGMFVYLISGASWPAVFPIALSGAAVVHRVLTVRKDTTKQSH